jgi:hypothetical protein
MRGRAFGIGTAAVLSASTLSVDAESALNKRFEVIQQGDFLLIGNTLAHNCASTTPKPIVGATTCPATGISDKGPDILWRAENASASADPMITPDMAQTAAVLKVPEGAVVTNAFVFWSARNFLGNDGAATLECLGTQPLSMFADSNQVGDNGYHAGKDVTAYVKQNGSCTYMVSGVASVDFKGSAESVGHSAWWMVVFYSHPEEPHRQLVLYDGLEYSANGDVEDEVSITGMLVPNNFTAFSKAKLGVVGYDGDEGVTGDQLLYVEGPGMEIPLQDNAKDPNDFFNSTRSYLGVPVSVAGDLPQLSGTPGSMSHLDMDVVDISDLIVAGTTQLGFKPNSVEPIYLAGLIASIPTFTDADKDGISDDEETLTGTDPNDADTDNDGVLDGQEGCSQVENCTNPIWNQDSDGDGLINSLDPDSDDDGLYDGTELGLDCSNPATDKWFGHCIADTDTGKTTTDPLDADSDDGGVIDGSEDANRDGAIDAGETDPTNGHPDDDSTNVDADGDGLSDPLEEHIGSDPKDADSDNDGVLDSDEASFADDTDGDGLPNVLDADSDNDALFDGTELGSQCDDVSTDVTKGHCRADADPSTGTSMVDADTDNGGVIDGSEDTNLNGKLDPGELDPTEGHGTDDATVKDSDGDGLSDDLEDILGSDKSDTDSDDDGVPDGEEANPSNDEDDDGLINVLDEDSDEDGLFDGTERGYGCGPGTDKTKGHCIPDADQGKTTTSMVNPDTDGGGVPDGTEDFDKDGKYEPNAGEGNPLDPSDDVGIAACSEDHPDCGPENNGKVCDTTTNLCLEGCRDVDGSRCPEGQVCMFFGGEYGHCVDMPGGDLPVPGEVIIYNGCICGVPSGGGGRDLGWALAASAVLAAWWRRRARRFE